MGLLFTKTIKLPDGSLKQTSKILNRYENMFMYTKEIQKDDFFWNNSDYGYSKKEETFDKVLEFCSDNNFMVAVGIEYGRGIMCDHYNNYRKSLPAVTTTCMFHILFGNLREVQILSDNTVVYVHNITRKTTNYNNTKELIDILNSYKH